MGRPGRPSRRSGYAGGVPRLPTPWLAGLLLLGSPVASAHLPHDVVRAVATVAPLEAGEPLLAILDDNPLNELFVSEDGGRTWTILGAPPMADTLADAARVRGQGFALLGAQGLWWGADGQAWRLDAAPEGALAIAGGDRLVLAAGTGLYGYDPATGAFTPEVEGLAFTGVFEGPAGLLAADGEGGVWRDEGGAWEPLPVLDAPARAGVWVGGDEVFVGLDAGTVLRLDGAAWRACGELPWLDLDPGHNEVAALAGDGATLLAARVSQGPAESLDGCDTWVDAASPQNIEWPEDGTGSATSTDGAFTRLAVGGDRWLSAGYDGVFLRLDGAWEQEMIRGPDYTRGIAFSHAFDEDGLVLLGTYGAGVTRATAGGRHFDAPGRGLTRSNIQAVVVPPEDPGLGEAWALANRDLVHSTDGGLSWTDVPTPFDTIQDLAVGPGRLWLLQARELEGKPAYTAGLAYSTDGGASFDEVWALAPSTGPEDVLGVVDGPDRVFVWTSGAVFEGATGLGTWSTAFRSGGEVRSVVELRDEQGAVVFVGDTEGVWREGEGQFDPVLEAPVMLLAVADDGTLYAATAAGEVYDSVDRGETWARRPVQLPMLPLSLAPRPGHADAPDLLIGGTDGVFRLRGDELTRWLTWNRTDDRSSLFTCEGCGSRDLGEAVLGAVKLVRPGETLAGWVRGDQGVVLGGAEGTTTWELRIDGQVVESRSVDPFPIGGALARWRADAWGWHRLELTVVDGDGLVIDALDAEGVPTPMDGDWRLVPPLVASQPDTRRLEHARPMPEPRGCGCATGAPPGALAVLLGLLLVGRRRR